MKNYKCLNGAVGGVLKVIENLDLDMTFLSVFYFLFFWLFCSLMGVKWIHSVAFLAAFAV